MIILIVVKVITNLINKINIFITNLFLYSTFFWAIIIKTITQIVSITNDLEIKSYDSLKNL